MLHNIQPTFWKSDKIIDGESNTVKLLLTNLQEIFLIATPNVKMCIGWKWFYWWFIQNHTFSDIIHNKAKIIGNTIEAIFSRTPDPICLRRKFSFVLSFVDFTIEHHCFLLFLITSRTCSSNSSSSTRSKSFWLVIKLNTTSRKIWTVCLDEFIPIFFKSSLFNV